MKSGTRWVIGLLLLGTGAGVFAVSYWKDPENSVRWSFTQMHASLVRGKKENVARLLAPTVVWNGREMSDREFLASYELPKDADRITSVPCPLAPGHWTVTMRTHVYCFVEEGPVFKLHWLGESACGCGKRVNVPATQKH